MLNNKNLLILKWSEVNPIILKRLFLNHIKGRMRYDALNNYYPNINKWFNKKVLKDLYNGKRDIILIIDGDSSPVILGYCIIKNYENEKKICCIRLDEKIRNCGYGSKLFEISFDILGTRKPIISIAEENKEIFFNIFKKYNFIQTSYKLGIYRDMKYEYFFNEPLETIICDK